AIVAQDFRALRGERLDIPFGRISPRVVYVLHRAVRRKAIVGQPDTVSAAQEQIALAVLTHHVPRINVIRESEIDRVAPGTGDLFRMDDIVGMVGSGARRNVYVV